MNRRDDLRLLRLPWWQIAHVTIAMTDVLKWIVLCVIGIIYGALVALVQRDIKKLVAYSSVSHLGFCVLDCSLNVIASVARALHDQPRPLNRAPLFSRPA